MNNIPPLASVRAFVEVAEVGAFNEASKSLGLSSSATSKAVTRLEEHLGVKLFHRTTRSIALTPEGERYLEGAKKLIAEFAVLGNEIADSIAAPVGRLKISAPVALGRSWLVDAITEFCSVWLKVHIELTLDDRTVDLAGDAVDVAIRAGALTNSDHLIARKLFQSPQRICASPNYWEKQGKPEHPEELKKHRCLMFRNPRTGRLYPWYFNQQGNVSHYVFDSVLEVNDGDAIVRAAVSGLGISQMPDYLGRRYLDSGELQEVLHSYRPDDVAFHALYLDRRLLSPRIREFIDFLIKWCEKTGLR